MCSKELSVVSRQSSAKQLGQSLIELVIVVAVVVIVVGALVFATIASLRNASFAKNQSQATKLAQEGIERVRTIRDRNQCVFGLSGVNSWNGNSDNGSCSGSGSIWSYRISTSCENKTATPPLYCYFKLADQGVTLSFLTPASDIPDTAESIPTDNPLFKRVIVLSDEAATFDSQKTVTVIVRWIDFSGMHESRLTTYLRKI